MHHGPEVAVRHADRLAAVQLLAQVAGEDGLGKLPGDFRFRLFGREFFIPLTSSVLLSLVAMGISKLF